MGPMWNLTPDYIQQVKEELKGRRAAIEARYADELKAIASDLDELETIERLAYSLAVKHLPEPAGRRRVRAEGRGRNGGRTAALVGRAG